MPQSDESCTRRRFMGAVSGAAAAAALSSLDRSVPAASAGQPRPNLLILQPDQHRGTIMGCAGDRQAITPNLDRLAAEGLRFTHCASSGPVCSPFRGTFQTGLYPHRHGVVCNNIRMDPALQTFAEVFAQAGYRTGYIGKWHLDGGWPPAEGGEGVTAKAVGGFVPAARRQGWQEWHGYEKSHEFFEVWQFDGQGKKVRVKGHDWEPAWHTNVALDFIRRQRDAGKPWVYYVAYGPPHLPKQCPEKFLDLYPPEKFTLPPDVDARLPEARKGDLRKEMQMYYALVTAIDHEAGRTMAGLKELGVDDNTIVLYTSDHGDRLGSHVGAKGRLRGKGAPQATAFRIPLIVRWPRAIARGQMCPALVSSVDFAPTVLDLAGLAIPGHMQGHSMAEWCRGGKGHERSAVYLALGDPRPMPPEAIRPSKRSQVPAGMKLALERSLPAGPGIGTQPTLRASGNWDCGYDKRLKLQLPPGRHRVMVEQVGRGRVEVEYTLRGYRAGQAEWRVPTSTKYCFKEPLHSEFAIGRDGSVTHAESLRPHLYGSSSRKRPPVLGLDCDQAAVFELRVTKSVGDKSKKLRIWVNADSAVVGVPSRAVKKRHMGWWRAVWDGRYVYRPGPKGWLYDHQTDPHEMTDLIDSPGHAAVRRRLGTLLLDMAQRSEDTVLPELREMLAKG